MPTKTDWFARGVKPVHVGVYETQPERGDIMPWFQYWNGSGWELCRKSPERAQIYRGELSQYQNPRWRGFTQKAGK